MNDHDCTGTIPMSMRVSPVYLNSILGKLIIDEPTRKVYERKEHDGETTYFFRELHDDGEIHIHAERTTDGSNIFASLTTTEAMVLA